MVSYYPLGLGLVVEDKPTEFSWLHTKCIARDKTIIYYNDGCHLRKYVTHNSRKDLTPITKRLPEMEIVVDKLHMQGHIDRWCRHTCDPYIFSELNNVSLHACYLLDCNADMT